MIEIVPNLHPLFVHFTVALLALTVGLHLLCRLMPEGEIRAQWQVVARWSLWFGMAITLLTLLSGWYAYNSVLHDAPSHLAMTDHRNWALATALLFLVATGLSVVEYRQRKATSLLLLAILLMGGGLLGSTAWRGGELVYRHGLGVMSLPAVSRHDHADGHHAAVASTDRALDAEMDTEMDMGLLQLEGEAARGATSVDTPPHDHAGHPH